MIAPKTCLALKMMVSVNPIEEQRFWSRNAGEGDHGGVIAFTNAGALQRDKANEKADASRNAPFQIHGDAIDEPLTNRNDTNDDENHSGDENRAKRRLPWVTHADHDDIRKECVLAHAGARPTGNRPTNPMRIEPSAAARQVATKTAPKSMPASDRMAGFTIVM